MGGGEGGREELGREGPFSLSHFSPSPPPLRLFEPGMLPPPPPLLPHQGIRVFFLGWQMPRGEAT